MNTKIISMYDKENEFFYFNIKLYKNVYYLIYDYDRFALQFTSIKSIIKYIMKHIFTILIKQKQDYNKFNYILNLNGHHIKISNKNDIDKTIKIIKNILINAIVNTKSCEKNEIRNLY